jgi:Holliday junction resolvase RusA-like endonuclease
MKISFVVQGQPQGKGRAKVTTRNGFAHAYTPEKTLLYENLIKVCFLEKKVERLQGALQMTIYAFYQIPKSFSKKKRDDALTGEIFPLTKPDVDNIAKVVCDALNGVAYEDDKQIVELTVKKYYSEFPKVIIDIAEV